jgi:hypothetical protein
MCEENACVERGERRRRGGGEEGREYGNREIRKKMSWRRTRPRHEQVAALERDRWRGEERGKREAREREERGQGALGRSRDRAIQGQGCTW